MRKSFAHAFSKFGNGGFEVGAPNKLMLAPKLSAPVQAFWGAKAALWGRLKTDAFARAVTIGAGSGTT